MIEITHRTTVFSTPWFSVESRTVRGLPDAAADGDYFAVRPHDYVTILAQTARHDFILVRQYRPTVEGMTLELPSGTIDRADELPAEVARRELREETGYEAGELIDLGCLVPDTGRLANRLWCYAARNVTPARVGWQPEPGIEVMTYSAAELMQAVTQGQLAHALHLAVLMRAFALGVLPTTLLP